MKKLVILTIVVCLAVMFILPVPLFADGYIGRGTYSSVYYQVWNDDEEHPWDTEPYAETSEGSWSLGEWILLADNYVYLYYGHRGGPPDHRGGSWSLGDIPGSEDTYGYWQAQWSEGPIDDPDDPIFGAYYGQYEGYFLLIHNEWWTDINCVPADAYEGSGAWGPVEYINLHPGLPEEFSPYYREDLEWGDYQVEFNVIAEVAIDIKPGSFSNSINLKSKGNVRVAILTDSTFDATTVDQSTVVFAGASPLQIGQMPKDVNSDGLLDVSLLFKTQDLNLQPGDTEACLSGKTFSGQQFEGRDGVCIVK